MTVYNEWILNLSYLPQNLTEEACYRLKKSLSALILIVLVVLNGGTSHTV